MPATPQPFARALVWALLRMLFTAFGMLVFYFLLPFAEITALQAFIRIVGGVILLAVVVGLQLRSIARANRPQMRAVEGIGLAFWSLVILFSIIYMSLSTALPASFSEPLNEIGALYFTVTTLTTVGFGDIVAVSDAARLVVTLQMIVGLVLLGAVVRLFLTAGSKAAATRKL